MVNARTHIHTYTHTQAQTHVLSTHTHIHTHTPTHTHTHVRAGAAVCFDPLAAAAVVTDACGLTLPTGFDTAEVLTGALAA